MEPHYLIDKEELLNFLTKEYSGFYNFIYDLIQKHDFLDREDDAMILAEDILDGLMNVIETAEVVEEREDAILEIREHHEHWGSYSRRYYLYHCSSCSEIVRQDCPDEEFKFCPYCGAKYERIVKDD